MTDARYEEIAVLCAAVVAEGRMPEGHPIFRKGKEYWLRMSDALEQPLHMGALVDSNGKGRQPADMAMAVGLTVTEWVDFATAVMDRATRGLPIFDWDTGKMIPTREPPRPGWGSRFLRRSKKERR